MKKIILVAITVSIIIFLSFLFFRGTYYKSIYQNNSVNSIFVKEVMPKNNVERAAYDQIGVVTEYDFTQGYYAGGRPPQKNTGVCTDVVVDALRYLGYDLQEKIFTDIKKRPSAYSDVPDKNINHRRAPNMNVYFTEHETSLPLDLAQNLETWRGGDIVVWQNHVAIVSNQRRRDGVPYVISNHGGGVMIADILDTWDSNMLGHFRIESLE